MIVLTSALVLAPLWKKHPQPMKPAHTRTKPLKGPSARNAQMPPRTAILKERAITCVMTYLPCDALWWSGTADDLHRRCSFTPNPNIAQSRLFVREILEIGVQS